MSATKVQEELPFHCSRGAVGHGRKPRECGRGGSGASLTFSKGQVSCASGASPVKWNDERTPLTKLSGGWDVSLWEVLETLACGEH